MRLLLPIIVYCVYVAFCWRVVFHARVWYRAAVELGDGTDHPHRGSLRIWMETAADVLLFRRLLQENGLLWICAWTFHVSFLLVVVRHMRYIMNPVPECITSLQTLGLLAGYVLPLSVVFIALIRTRVRERYVSRSNYFILGLVFLIGVTGLLLHIFRTDLVGTKEFVLGILAFSPHPVPKSPLFIVHLLFALLLLLYLPFHVFIAPVIMHEARKREAGLKRMLHEK